MSKKRNTSSRSQKDLEVNNHGDEKIVQYSDIISNKSGRETDDMLASMMGLTKTGPYNKWVSITLAVSLGWLGLHKFYEEKYFLTILYACTIGFVGLGVLVDVIALLYKPKYYSIYR
jgi:hypothetical protein